MIDLADPASAGVHRVDAAEARALERSARARGLFAARVALGDRPEKRALLQRLSEALSFPGYFGSNWDAAWDCLDDLSWLSAPGFVVILDEADPSYALGLDLEALLGEAVASWRARGVAFSVLVVSAAAGAPPPPATEPPG